VVLPLNLVSCPLQNGQSSIPYFVEWSLMRKVDFEGHPRDSTFWSRLVVCLCCCDLLLWQQLMTGQFFNLGFLPGPSKIYLACMCLSWCFLKCSANIDCTWADHLFCVCVVCLIWFGAEKSALLVRGYLQELRGIAFIDHLSSCKTFD